MKNRIARCIALVGLVAGTLWTAAQAPPPLQRTPNTTNTATGVPANDEVPTWDAANNRWDFVLPPGAGGGEANTGANLGASGNGVYASKVGVELQFNKLAAGTGLSLASNANILTFSFPVQYQQTNGNLTLLSAYGPTTWQATNANLTLLQAYGPTTWQATNANLTLLQAFGPTTWQATNGNLTLWAAITPFNTNVNYGSALEYTITNLLRSFGTANFNTLTVVDDAYAAGWDGSTNTPTKNAVYDKIQSLALSGVTNFDNLSAMGMIVSNNLYVAGSLILTGTGGTELDSMQITNKLTNLWATATRVLFSASDKSMTDDSGMTYVAGTDTLTVGAISLGATNVAGELAAKANIVDGGTNLYGAIALKAPIANPIFTGTVEAPTISVATTTQGTVTMTNSPTFPLTTSWSAHSDTTNYVADLTIPVLHFTMTTNMNFLHATNGTANFTANTMKQAQFILINSSGTNWTNKFPTSWKRYGDVADSTFYVTNGDWCRMAIQFAGPTTDQTNVHVAVVYENN